MKDELKIRVIKYLDDMFSKDCRNHAIILRKLSFQDQFFFIEAAKTSVDIKPQLKKVNCDNYM